MRFRLKFIDSEDRDVNVHPWVNGDVTTSLGVWTHRDNIFRLDGVGKIGVCGWGEMSFQPKHAGLDEAGVLAEFGRSFYEKYAPQNIGIVFMEVFMRERV